MSPRMNLSQTRLCLGLGLLLLVTSACAAPAPAPTGVVLLPSLTPTPTAKPTCIQAVRDTATALALAAQLGGTPTASISDMPSAEPAATEPAAETPAEPSLTETPIVDFTATPIDMTGGASRTPIGNPTGQALPAGCAALHTVQAGEYLTA